MVSCIIWISVDNSADNYKQAALENVESNIKKAVVTCYSVEGYYPSDLQYLIDNYGLVINTKKMNVFYQSLGSNLFPDIMVTYKGAE